MYTRSSDKNENNNLHEWKEMNTDGNYIHASRYNIKHKYSIKRIEVTEIIKYKSQDTNPIKTYVKTFEKW